MSLSTPEPVMLASRSDVASEKKTQSVIISNGSKPKSIRRPSKHERKGFQVLRFRIHVQQRKQRTHPYGALSTRDTPNISLQPFKGNTDPFSVAAVAINPTTHELLSLCHHLVLFRDYPLWAASMYERRVKDAQALAIQCALGNPAMLHCFLAAGCYIKSQPNDANQISALKHKSHVLVSVSKQLASSQDVEMEINYLILFDSLVGDYLACEVHWHALRAIVASSRSRDHTISLHNLWIRDVWLAHYQNRETLLDVDMWDKPVPILQHRVHNDDLSFGCQADPFLLDLMKDIRESISLQIVAIQMSDSAMRDELVERLYLHSAANNGRLINYWVRLDTGLEVTSAQALNAAITLSIMCFLQLPYSNQHYSASQSIRQRQLEPLLLRAGLNVNNDLLLWLYFIGATNDTLLPSPTHWAYHVFLNLRAKHRNWLDTRIILEKFLYIEGMEERLMRASHRSLPQPDDVHHLLDFRRRVSELPGMLALSQTRSACLSSVYEA